MSTTTSSTSAARFWERRIARTRRRVNLGWWLERFGPGTLVTGVAAACAVLSARSTGGMDWPWTWWAGGAGGVVVVLAALSWLLARRRFITADQAMVRLEAELRLHNALTAARAGLREWPTPPPASRPVEDGWAWNWPRLVAPPVGTAILLAGAFLMPIRPVEGVVLPPQEPMAWQEMESWLEELRQQGLADAEVVEELERKIEALRDQPAEEWFGHGSLEATDSLRESLERALSELQRHTADAGVTLSAAARLGEGHGKETEERLGRELAEALQGLEAGKLPADAALREQLQSLDPSSLRQLDAATCQGMCDKLGKNAEALRKMLAESGNPFGEEGEGGLSEKEILRLLGELPGEEPGRGGVQRGRGDAPMFHEDQESQLGTGNLERITNEDLERAAPGDMLGEIEVKQDPVTEGAAVRSGGNVGSVGRGGNRVWDADLMPAEQDVLRKFYQ